MTLFSKADRYYALRIKPIYYKIHSPYILRQLSKNCKVMSSLAASRADGFYFPPEYFEQKKLNGLSKFRKSKGANQYEQFGIIRFELPFDGWCLKCNQHMGKGLRFNAKKEKAGMYFTTQIFSFDMKCYSCDQRFIIRTDPEHRTYDYAEGIRKHEQDYVPDIGDSVIELTSDEKKTLLENDPMFRLQHVEESKRKVLTAQEQIKALTALQESHHKNDYDVNSKLRSINRKRKKRDLELLQQGRDKGLSIAMVEPSDEDERIAKQIKFHSNINQRKQNEAQKIANITKQKIFASKSNSKDPSMSAINKMIEHKTIKAPVIVKARIRANSDSHKTSNAEIIVKSSSISSKPPNSDKSSSLSMLNYYSDEDD